jgi:murein DD-endopeptidase MepM/ murein hydrolase activator NlpD
VITKNVAGNYINSYDTSLDMNPRNGISLTGKNINLKAGYRFNAGDGLGGTVATTMGNLNLGGREISIDAYNNTEYMFTVLYQALEYLVNATSGGMALGKEDINIADYIKFSQDNLEALIKLVRKANQLWAKRKEIVKQKEEAARLEAEMEAALEAKRIAEEQRQKEEDEEKKKRLEAEKQRREEANLEGNGDETTGTSSGSEDVEDGTIGTEATSEVPEATTTTEGNEVNFSWPITEDGFLTSVFGKYDYYLDGKYHRNEHGAIDIAASAGTPVTSIAEGKVLEVGNNAAYGNYVLVEHADGYKSKYSHLRDISSLKVGEAVAQGKGVGVVGSTGKSTGNHLDLEITKNGTKIDPLSVLGALPQGIAPSIKNGYLRDDGKGGYSNWLLREE